MKNKSLFNRLLENKKLMIILSLLLALMFWVITSDNMTKTINNVPVECSLSDGVDSELVVFPKSIDNVSVVVAGKRVLLQSLNPEDIDAYVDLSEVNAPITANFDIQVKNRNSGYEIESIEPESVRLVIDREVTKSVEVFSDFDYSPEGYYVDNNLPQTIDISGPEGIVDRIKCAYVSGNVSSYNAQTVTNTFDIKLYDTENIGSATDENIISTDYLTINKKIEVTFRFLKLAENVPFTAGYTPADISISSDFITFTPSNISLAGPESLMTGDSAIKNISVDIGSLSQYKNQIYNLTYHIQDVLPKDFVNKSDGVDTVKVQLDFSSLESKTIEVPANKIKVINLDDKYSYKPSGNYPVTVIGTESALEELDYTKLSVLYDFKDSTVEARSNYLDAKVSITLSSDKLCWVYRTSDVQTVTVEIN